MFNFIEPTFSLFGLQVYWYAICIFIGVVFAVIAGIREGKKIGIPSDYIITGVIIVLPCAIVGARLWYILFNLDQSWSFQRIIGLEGGLSGLAIQGGIIASMIAIYIYCRCRKISLYRILDVVAPGFLIGQICGRWGNFCNHELYGPIVQNKGVAQFLYNIPILGPNMCFKVHPITPTTDLAFMRHPVFLYESFLNLVGLILMLVLRRKFKKLNSGDLIGGYFVWYGIVRIFTESLRSQSGANEILMAGPIPVSILFSILFIVGGLAFLIIKRFIGPKINYQEIMQTIKENRYDTILFDLDGTLLNTRSLINQSFIYTFHHFRPDLILSDEELDSFFGPSLKQTFSRYSEDEKEIEEMIKFYREYNVSIHDTSVTAFSGAKSLISTLSRKGYKLGVVSSKKKDLVEHGLELFGMKDKMQVIIGEDDVKAPKPDPEGILEAMRILDSKKALYVGDGVGDIQAGKNANIDTVGVLYSGRTDKIIEANPTYTIKRLSDILSILME